MKKIILRLLWVDDDQIRRKGRIFGWFGIACGIFLLVGGFLLLLFLNQKTKIVEVKTEEIVIALTTDPELSSLANINVEAAVKTLKVCGRVFRKMPLPLVVLCWGFGFSTLSTACLYFKVHKTLNMNPQQTLSADAVDRTAGA